MSDTEKEEDKELNQTNFSNQRCAIPFGKFESGSDDTYPCNESMVGREGARAKLIDFLTNAGTRKAILVTGRRGMGKSRFVQYCLNEYEESNVERYWRNDIGRTVRSLLWLIIVSIPFALAFLMGGRVLQILLHNANQPENHIFWIPVVLLVIGLGYPLVIAFNIFSTLSHKISEHKHTLIGFAILVGLILMLVIMPYGGTGSPIVTLSRLLVAMSAVYLAGEISNIVIKLKLDFFSKLAAYSPAVMMALTILATYILNPIVEYSGFKGENSSVPVPGVSALFSNIIVTSLFFICAVLFKVRNTDTIPFVVKKLQIDKVIQRTKPWYVITGLVMLIPMLAICLLPLFDVYKINFKHEIGWLVPAIIFFTAFIPIKHGFCKSETTTKESTYLKLVMANALLSLKATFFVLISIYAMHPFVSRIVHPDIDLLEKCNWSIYDEIHGIKHIPPEKIMNTLDLSKTNGLLVLVKDRPYCSGYENFNKETYLPLFFGKKVS